MAHHRTQIGEQHLDQGPGQAQAFHVRLAEDLVRFVGTDQKAGSIGAAVERMGG